MTTFTRHYKDKKLIEISMIEIESLIKDSKNKSLIAEYVYERLYNRFLKIFDYTDTSRAIYNKHGEEVEKNIFKEEYKNGFLIMTSCSLLIETLASFLIGHNMTPQNKQKEMFTTVFEYAEIKNNELMIFKDLLFYKHIRCGLLHQGETYGKFMITREGTKVLDDMTVNAHLFFIHLKSLLLSYKEDLIIAEWDSKEWDACRQKIRYIVSNSI